MNLTYSQEIEANLERAEESLHAAEDLYQHAYYDIAASRSYYTAFYAATALLLCEELAFQKHSAVISQRCTNTFHVPQADAERAIEAAENFLQAVKTLIIQYS